MFSAAHMRGCRKNVYLHAVPPPATTSQHICTQEQEPAPGGAAVEGHRGREGASRRGSLSYHPCSRVCPDVPGPLCSKTLLVCPLSSRFFQICSQARLLLVAPPNPQSCAPPTSLARSLPCTVARHTRGLCASVLPCTCTACHLPASCWHKQPVVVCFVLFNASC